MKAYDKQILKNLSFDPKGPEVFTKDTKCCLYEIWV